MSKNTMKVAKLVTFEVTTRVVVDVNVEDVMEEDAYNNALEKFKQEKVENIVCLDNVTEITNDIECPFGTFYEDLSTELRKKLYGLYEKASKCLYGCEYFSEHEIVKESANIFVENIEELSSIEGRFKCVYDILKKCANVVVNGVEADYNEYIGGACSDIVEELSGYLGEFFA